MVTAPRTTRERLLRAARELTEEGGYAAAPVTAIAERAGVATGTLYRHWPSKGALFAELFRDVCDREARAMADADAAAEGVLDRMDAVVGTFASRALRNPRLAWALIAEPVDPLVEAERLAYRRRYAQLFAGTLREGIATGALPEQDADLTAAALVGALGEALVGPTSPLTTGPTPTEELIAAMTTFTRRAVGASA